MNENKQVLRSRKWIFEALMKLMRENAFKDISISDITSEAGVARLTFYRNYNSKEDIIIHEGRKIYDKLMDDLNKTVYEKDIIYNSIKKIITVFNDSANLFRLLLRDNLDYLIMQSFEIEISNILKVIFGVDNTDKYKVKFYEGALFAIAVEWIKNSREESIDEMTDIIYKLIYKY
ncbi:MAG: HTH-type transcriptional repressor FabR [Candidatus Izimaplasma bacterium HR2]|nr:MAG: HTH-type transcriptional repressor FabR [Candidatus Izimaplasma bacterium HR2]